MIATNLLTKHIANPCTDSSSTACVVPQKILPNNKPHVYHVKAISYKTQPAAMKLGLEASCLHPVLPQKCKQQWRQFGNVTPCTVQLTESIAVQFVQVNCAGVQHGEKTCTVVQTRNSFRKQSLWWAVDLSYLVPDLVPSCVS